ncbi:MAG: DUF3383 domain-containing protein [Acidobacteriia bacterium]|nr:DUF3383 domain-containing protein [Terriglobia bacterium]
MRKLGELICAVLLSSTLSLCIGCGGGQPTPLPGQGLPPISGNYSFQLGTFGAIGGPLATTAGNVTGGIILSDSVTSCQVGVFNVFGSIKAGGALSLFASAAGASLNLDGTVSADGKTISAATFTMTGTAGCVASGSATGVQMQDLSGVYSGTLTLTHGGVAVPISWSGALSQTVLTTGFIELTGGDATVGGIPAACGFTTSTFSVVGGGLVFGAHSSGNFQGGANGFNFKADATDATAKTLNVSMFVQGGPCAADTVAGTLSRP